MIYLKNNTEKQKVYIPIVDDISVEMRLKLTDSVSKSEVIIPVFDQNVSKLYFLFEISLPSLQDGQYDYELLDENDAKMASGIVQIGDFIPQKTEYNNEKSEYIVYGE